MLLRQSATGEGFSGMAPRNAEDAEIRRTQRILIQELWCFKCRHYQEDRLQLSDTLDSRMRGNDEFPGVTQSDETRGLYLPFT